MKRRTDLNRIAIWVDEVVAEHWTMEAAARVYHICSTGFDGAVAPAKTGTRPHQHAVSSDKVVPGACAPVRTAYHAAQALSWVASRRSAVEDQISWTHKVHQLIEKLGYITQCSTCRYAGLFLPSPDGDRHAPVPSSRDLQASPSPALIVPMDRGRALASGPEHRAMRAGFCIEFLNAESRLQRLPPQERSR
jgi:hypothetical protein